MNLHLPESYVENLSPVHYDDFRGDGLCQQAVYDFAVLRAKELGAVRILDFGCGSAVKLIPHRDRFMIVAVDQETVVDNLRGYLAASTPRGLTLPRGFLTVGHDFERDLLKMASTETTIIVCADVIEHLVDPTNLLASIRHALTHGALRAFISTPCRTHCPGISKKGPPNNAAHVREWTCAEFERLMTEARLEVVDTKHMPERPGAEGKGTFLVEVVDAA